MNKSKVTKSRALTKRAGYAKFGALLALSPLSAAAWAGTSAANPEVDLELRTVREAIKQCGTVSYDPQGGSLVINNYEVQVANPSLEANLIREARTAPFSACLIGSWLNLPRGKVFRADAIDD